MNIIILHQHFRTPGEGGGIRSYYLAKALLAAGYTVDVVTAWNGQQSKVVTLEGIAVHYLPVFYENRMGFYERVYSFLKFIVKAYWRLEELEKPDYLYAISTPLSTGVLAIFLRKRRGIPFIFEIGDLWPQVPVQMGVLKNSFLIGNLKRMERAIYRTSHRLVAMSPPIFDYLKELGHEKKTLLITNFSDLSLGQTEASDSTRTLEEKPFTLVYTGAIGKANHLGFLLDLAAEAVKKGIGKFRCGIMGDGAEKKKLMAIAKGNKLRNVQFYDHGSKEEAFRLLKSADMAYISFDSYSMLWKGSPNKYFDALAAGKPVLCNFGGWIAEEVEGYGCGCIYDPQHPETFFDSIWPQLNATKLKVMGENAYQLATGKYSLEAQLPKWLSLFKS